MVWEQVDFIDVEYSSIGLRHQSLLKLPLALLNQIASIDCSEQAILGGSQGYLNKRSSVLAAGL